MSAASVPPPSPAKTLVCFALKEEAKPFLKTSETQAGIDVLITGIGRQNARRSVEAPISKRPPGIVLTCGFAGGLEPGLKIGDVVFATDDALLNQKLSAAGAKVAKILCHGRVATTTNEKKKLRLETGADVVEMESAEIQAVCRERRIPCATVRVISDTAGEDLPLDFNRLSKPDMSLDYGKLAWEIATHPGKIGALQKLQKQTGFAAERLAQVLRSVLVC